MLAAMRAAQFRRRHRLHQDRGGAGRAVRARLSRRDADGRPRRRHRAGDGGRHGRCPGARRRARSSPVAGGRSPSGSFPPRFFALAAIGFRAGVIERRDAVDRARRLDDPRRRPRHPEPALLAPISRLFDRAGLAAIFAVWRASLLAGFMGALASQFWFLAFALDRRGAGAHAGAGRSAVRADRVAAPFREAPSLKRMARHGADRRRGGGADQRLRGRRDAPRLFFSSPPETAPPSPDRPRRSG